MVFLLVFKVLIYLTSNFQNCRKLALNLKKSIYKGFLGCNYTVCSGASDADSSSCFFNSSSLALS